MNVTLSYDYQIVIMANIVLLSENQIVLKMSRCHVIVILSYECQNYFHMSFTLSYDIHNSHMTLVYMRVIVSHEFYKVI